jgi:hypothetical protein
MWHYRARIYSPTLGRFLQTDPIGYGDGMNMYAYVGGDPVNFVDPLGLCTYTFTGDDPGFGGQCRRAPSPLDRMRYERQNSCASTFADILDRCREQLQSDLQRSRAPSIPAAGPDPCAGSGTTSAARTGVFSPEVNFAAILQEKFEQHVSPSNSNNLPQSFWVSDYGYGSLVGDVFRSMSTVPVIPTNLDRLGRQRYRATFNTGRPVGYQRLTGINSMTHYLTIIWRDTGRLNDDGIRIFEVISAYPGCP